MKREKDKETEDFRGEEGLRRRREGAPSRQRE
jgi:hypothetical protein